MSIVERPEYEFFLNFENGDHIELQSECIFQGQDYSYDYTNGRYVYDQFLAPKGTLVRIDKLHDSYCFSVSILLKYNRDFRKKLEDFKPGKYTIALKDMSGVKYTIIKDINGYVKTEARKRKIESLLSQ
jgi:hypothetical protein